MGRWHRGGGDAIRGEHVDRHVDELHRTCPKNNVLFVGIGRPHGPCAIAGCGARSSSRLVLSVRGELSQAVPPEDHHRAVRRVQHPVRLHEQSSSNKRDLSIKLNYITGPYFQRGKGVRQRDPLSLFLFNLAAGSLAKIIKMAQQNRLLVILVQQYIENGIVALQYADDIIIYLQENREMTIINLKLMLYFMGNCLV